jgi:hypothetical protein
MHLQALKKMRIIDELVMNKEYAQALQLHEKLCIAYPGSYAKSYGIKIAKTCFECSRYNKSFFKKGITFLQDQVLSEEQFFQLHQIVPWQLKEKYITLFDVSYYGDKVKKYQFTLNNDEVKLL